MKHNPLEFIKRFIQYLKHYDALICVQMVRGLDRSFYRIYIITNYKSYEFSLNEWNSSLEVSWKYYKDIKELSAGIGQRFLSIDYAEYDAEIKYLEFDFELPHGVNISEAIGATVVAPSDFQSVDT